MRPAVFHLAALATVLAGCSKPTQNDAATEPNATSSPSPTASANGATPMASSATATTIPERFRGVWDHVEGSCDPASDLRMDVGAGSIEFYESLGTVTGVTVESPVSIVVDLAMEGEGERWTWLNRYVLSDDGATLTPSELGGSPAAPMPRKRCAGRGGP